MFAAIATVTAACAALVAFKFWSQLKASRFREAQAQQQLRDREALLESAREQLAAANDDVVELHAEVVRLAKRTNELARYEHVADVETRAAIALKDAEAKLAASTSQATAIVSSAEADARTVRETATHEAEHIRRHAEQEVQIILESARATARAESDEAQKQLMAAIAAANDALEARRHEAEVVRAEVQPLVALRDAIRNTLEGYGDRYITITANLLDGLAQDFGHTEAGRKLKDARAATRARIASGGAADCDYSEEYRRKTAIAFILDAFNGKVDSILADIRDDNFGTLSQKLNDAFVLVNQHGKAFRNARILPEYLESRRSELRWGVVAVELRTREREEQRAIKEKIREEERAQREYERAQREAEKEQALIEKTLERARKELDAASAEQRQTFEAKITLLNQQLEEARLKGERAMSMAQQTKAGHVYVISNIGSFGEDVFKIGLTRRLDPLERIYELGDASVPFAFDVHAMIKSEDAPALEYKLHQHFVMRQVNKVNPRKEFFRAALREIREEIERLGCEVTWTMTAEAREYRETLAIERGPAKATPGAEQWLEQQLLAQKDAIAEPV